jgi:Tol biopolymer transport system component
VRRALVLVACAVLVVPSAAHAAFPGQNGKILFFASDPDPLAPKFKDLWTINPDGANRTRLTNTGLHERDATWSADGQRIIYSAGQPDFKVIDAQGASLFGLEVPEVGLHPAWSPQGDEIAYSRWEDVCNPEFCTSAPRAIRIVRTDGTGDRQVVGLRATHPAWSPDGSRIAFVAGGQDGIPDIWVVAVDGTGLVDLTGAADPEPYAEENPQWSPDGSRLVLTGWVVAPEYGACCSPNRELFSIAADGTDLRRLTRSPLQEFFPAWSPDGTKIAFSATNPDLGGQAGIFVMNSDGTNVAPISNADAQEIDWQPIPINAYPRPRGATPIQVSMVPAYNQCTSPTRTHGPPLAFPSCSSPAQASDELTVGTADSNGKATKSRGLVRYDAIVGAPATPADEADVQVTVELSDIYEQGTLADYSGELRARTSLRITDKLNTPHPGGPGAATVSDASLGATVPCAATADTTEGASCNLVTTFDALVPGTVTETKRSIWELGAAQLDDGGADGDADTTGDNTLFMTQGVFVP